jgi:hypothetical protein
MSAISLGQKITRIDRSRIRNWITVKDPENNTLKAVILAKLQMTMTTYHQAVARCWKLNSRVQLAEYPCTGRRPSFVGLAATRCDAVKLIRMNTMPYNAMLCRTNPIQLHHTNRSTSRLHTGKDRGVTQLSVDGCRL